MKIGGFQKLSLVDFPGTVSAVAFTPGCGFSCSYCHNPDLISPGREEVFTVSEVIDELKKSRRMIDGVVITGGEPTIHEGLAEFLKEVRRLELLIKLDTNGMHPFSVEQIIKNNLVDYIAMDIKSSWKKYSSVTGIAMDERLIRNCGKTLSIIQDSGIDHEFRTTVFPAVHSLDDFREIASYLIPGEKSFLQKIRPQTTLSSLEEELSHPEGIAAVLREEFPLISIEAR